MIKLATLDLEIGDRVFGVFYNVSSEYELRYVFGDYPATLRYYTGKAFAFSDAKYRADILRDDKKSGAGINETWRCYFLKSPFPHYTASIDVGFLFKTDLSVKECLHYYKTKFLEFLRPVYVESFL